MDSLNVLLLLATLLCAFRVSEQGAIQRHLYQHLLKNYSSLERPVQNDSQVLNVEVTLHLRQIMDVDEKSQVLTTNVWLQMMWNDYALQWDPKEYPGVRNVQFPNELLWKPDIVLYNSADEQSGAAFHAKIVVSDTGACVYLPSVILKSTCKMDVRWFPFDEQRCELKFGSWTYNGRAINLKMQHADVSQYMPNGEWHLVEVPGEKTVTTYSCCPDEPYPEVAYTVVMRRRTLFYSLNLLIPCILISTLALLVFLLPADSGQKITLGITVLLSLMVVMLLVAQVMPATSDTVPLISQYFAAIMVIVGLSVMATVLVLQFHHHDPNGSKMPKWTRVFLLNWCARFLCMKRPGCPNVSADGLDGKPLSIAATSPESGVRLVHTGEKEPSAHSMEPELGKVLDEVRYIAARFRDQDQEEMVCNEWKFAACVVDRLCLLAFSLVTILCTIGILVFAPGFA